MKRNFLPAYSNREFKMMKNGLYFIVIAPLVAKLFKILINANLMTCDVTMWTQSDVKSQKMKSLSRLSLYRTQTVRLLHSSQTSMICPLWHFHGNTMGSRPSPFKEENQSFPPSRSVIWSCCSFSGCERIGTLHSTSRRKCVKLWSIK